MPQLYVESSSLFLDGSSCLDLLYGEDYRAAGYGLLCAAEEDVASFISARLPSHADADLCVHWSKISGGWTRNTSGSHKLIHSRAHVHLLHAVSYAIDAEIPLVEEILDYLADREWNISYSFHEIFLLLLESTSLYSLYSQIQFLIVFCHTIQIQFQPSCNFPKSIGALLTLNAALFTYMFSSFYIRTYKRARERDVKNDKQTNRDENGNVVMAKKDN